jgi:HPt (histidine-containing phosphotransfer) domain-containing protein
MTNQSDDHTMRQPERAVFAKDDFMERLTHDEALAKKVAGMFLGDIPRQLAALRGYLDAGDIHAAERQGHTVRGAAANVGGEALASVAGDLERAAGAGDPVLTQSLFAQLTRHFDLLSEAMTGTLGVGLSTE